MFLLLKNKVFCTPFLLALHMCKWLHKVQSRAIVYSQAFRASGVMPIYLLWGSRLLCHRHTKQKWDQCGTIGDLVAAFLEEFNMLPSVLKYPRGGWLNAQTLQLQGYSGLWQGSPLPQNMGLIGRDVEGWKVGAAEGQESRGIWFPNPMDPAQLCGVTSLLCSFIDIISHSTMAGKVSYVANSCWPSIIPCNNEEGVKEHAAGVDAVWGRIHFP